MICPYSSPEPIRSTLGFLSSCLTASRRLTQPFILTSIVSVGFFQATVEKVIADNPQSVADYRAGKEKAIGFLVGQTMKAMQGKANPGMVNKLLKELL